MGTKFNKGVFTMDKLKKIFVVFKTHFDIGFTALSSEIKARYSSEMIPNAMDTCIKSKENDSQHPYVWTIPAWPLTSVLRDDCEGLEDLIKKN
jgi:alpha-mannosidase